MFTLLFSIANGSHASSLCIDSVEQADQAIITLQDFLNPRKVLKNKIKLEDIKFLVAPYETNYGLKKPGLTFTVFHKGELALEMRFGPLYDSKLVHSSGNHKESVQFLRGYAGTVDRFKSYEGNPDFYFKTGLGSLSYLVIAQYIWKTQSAPLMSDTLGQGHDDMVSPAARRVWNRFSDKGLAHHTSTTMFQRYSFIPEALQKSEFAMIRELIDAQLETQETQRINNM